MKKVRKQSNTYLQPLGYLLIFLLSIGFASGQAFRYQVVISGVQKNGLHKLPLSPALRQLMSSDLHDVRLFDAANKEVPYVVLSEPVLRSKSDFVNYAILSQIHHKAYSEIIIENPDKQNISNIAFNINNSDVLKHCTIEGSDDRKQWYSVSTSQQLSLAYNTDYTNTCKCIYFPLNNYRYFRLLIDDWQAEPFKINQAGYFKNSVIAGKLNEVYFTKSITEDKKNKISTIKLSFINPQTISRIDFNVSAPRLFKRHARIYVNRREQQKRKTLTYRETLFEFELSSDKVLFFDLPDIHEKELFIEIENRDNPALTFESISCKQQAVYLVCDLNVGKPYTLKFGNTSLNLPDYDLINFVNTVPQLMPEAKIGGIKEIFPRKKNGAIASHSFFESRLFLWLCIGLGALVILYFSATLLKDMSQGRKDE